MATEDRLVDVSLSSDKVDTYILDVENPTNTTSAVQFSFGKSSQKVSGINKMAGMFVKKLFTLKGSNPLDLNEGTEFPELIGSNVGDSEDFMLIVQNAVSEAAEQLKFEQQNQDLPDDEKLFQAKVLKFEFITADAAELYIDLYSASGSKAKIKLPQIELS